GLGAGDRHRAVSSRADAHEWITGDVQPRSTLRAGAEVARGWSVALWRWPGVDDRAEQLRGLLRVIQRRVCVLAAPLETRGLHRARKHGLAICHARQRDRVEHAEGVERIA